MTHAHLTALVLTCILFSITVFLQGQGKNIKFWQMGLRASYVLVLGTGLMLLFSLFNITFIYIVKAIVGFLIIGLFEMVIAWRAKGEAGKSNLDYVCDFLYFVNLFRTKITNGIILFLIGLNI